MLLLLTSTLAAVRVLLVRVPKTASESMQRALKDWKRSGWCDIDLQVVHMPDDLSRRPTAEMLSGHDKVIITSREPLSRFVSAFNWRCPSSRLALSPPSLPITTTRTVSAAGFRHAGTRATCGRPPTRPVRAAARENQTAATLQPMSNTRCSQPHFTQPQPHCIHI